jgi:hypothetical protein
MERFALTNEQTQILQMFRERVKRPYIDFFITDEALTRILIAREFDIEAAVEMWKRWKDWRQSYQPERITEDEMSRHIFTGKAFFHGHDKKGRPCLIVRARFHFPSQFTAEETIRYSIFLAESACRESDRVGTGQICMIYDRAGITDDNQDPQFISLIKEMAEVFKDFYAERLGALFILHVSVFHWILYHALKGTIPKRTREKLHVMRNPGNLIEFFDSDQLLVEHGGSDEYIHPYPR